MKERVSGFSGESTSKSVEVERHIAILEILSEKVLAAMEDKESEAKRARTVRYEYHRDVEQVQSWICQAEGRVQDRSLEPQTLKDFLQVLPVRLLHTGIPGKNRPALIRRCVHPCSLNIEIEQSRSSSFY